MIYHCDACNYTFDSIQYARFFKCNSSIPSRCPDCGKMHLMNNNKPTVRIATEDEIAEYKQIQKEIEAEFKAAV